MNRRLHPPCTSRTDRKPPEKPAGRMQALREAFLRAAHPEKKREASGDIAVDFFEGSLYNIP